VSFLIAIEELCAVDPGFPTISARETGSRLHAAAVVRHGRNSGRNGSAGRPPIPGAISSRAGAVSERGGTANFDHPEPPRRHSAHGRSRQVGRAVRAERGKSTGRCNSGGWDSAGCRRQPCASCGTEPHSGRQGGPEARFLVERDTAGVEYEVIDKMAHRACQKRDDDLPRRPASRRRTCWPRATVTCLINRNFTWSAPIASIAAVGVARGAYEFALKWSKTFTGGGSEPDHQPPGGRQTCLTEIAAKIEAGRYFLSAGKAAPLHGQVSRRGARARRHEQDVLRRPHAECLCSTCMRIVGVNSLDRKFPDGQVFYREGPRSSRCTTRAISRCSGAGPGGVMADPSLLPGHLCGLCPAGVHEVDGGLRGEHGDRIVRR